MEPTPSSSSSPEVARFMALSERLSSIYASPAEVFEEVRMGARSHANWLIPLLLAYAMIVIHINVAFSQPTVLQGVREQQEKQILKMVESGKLTEAQAEGAIQQIERFMTPTVLKISGSIGGIITGTVWTFALVLVLWLLSSKILKGPTTFFQILEVNGLASMITLLGFVISIFLVISTGNMFANIGPILFIKDFNPANYLHLALASINAVTLWYLAILSIGIAKVSNVGVLKPALWIFGAWIALRTVIIWSGWGSSGF